MIIWKDIYKVRGCIGLAAPNEPEGEREGEFLFLNQGIRGKHARAKFLGIDRKDKLDPKAIFLCYDQNDTPLPCQIVGFVQAVQWVFAEDERIERLNAGLDEPTTPEIQKN